MSLHDNTPLLLRRRSMMVGLATIALTLGPLETATSQVTAHDAAVIGSDPAGVAVDDLQPLMRSFQDAAGLTSPGEAGVPTGRTPPVPSRLQTKAQDHGRRV
jgi:hypothetical protein